MTTITRFLSYFVETGAMQIEYDVAGEKLGHFNWTYTEAVPGKQ